MISIACFHPAFIHRSVKLSTGDVTTKFLGSDTALKFLETGAVLKESYNGQKVLDFIPRTYSDGCAHDFIKIPCGKCIGCRMDYSRSWADRMTYHVKGKEENSWFLTLTYDDVHLEELEHSTNYDLYSLNYDHLADFIKRLRNKFRDSEIDFFASGEYGDQQFRPHFHAIVYNVPLDDLEYWKLNSNGDPLYTSEIIHSLWQRGICAVGKYNWLCAAYAASYVEKKRDGRKLDEYTAVGLIPEKCRMSRRPGIAHDYYVENALDIWNHDGLSVSRSVNSQGHLGIPRYFRKLVEKRKRDYEEEYSAFMDFQKRSLERSNVLNPFKVDNSSFDLDRVSELLKFEERELLSKSVSKKL